MIKLFVEGGPLFMGILTALLFVIVILTAFYVILISGKNYKDINLTRSRLKYIKSIGVFTMITGFLGQMVGLFEALDYIQKSPDISPMIMAGGLKVSMITPMYGMVIFLISYLCWIALDYLAGIHTKA